MNVNWCFTTERTSDFNSALDGMKVKMVEDGSLEESMRVSCLKSEAYVSAAPLRSHPPAPKRWEN